MSDDLLNYGFQSSLDSIIKVIGVGGGGGNAVNHMFRMGISGVDFMVCNTDAQALENSPVPVKIQLGVSLTDGKGAGNKPKRGEQAAIENLADIREVLECGTRMVFITAGMGGGTGTGAAPVIAQLTREMDILTIAVVTLPSIKEGRLRFNQAMEGVEKLKKYVDSLLVINNENLHRIYGDLPASKAFGQADNILATAVKGSAEIITLHGNINIDFADVNTVMRQSGVFIMGTGIASGENRAMKAVQEAMTSPLLDSNDIRGTENILLNITSGEEEILMGEIGIIIDFLQDAAGDEANIIWGNGLDKALGNQISVTIIATGFKTNTNSLLQPEAEPEKVQLTDLFGGVIPGQPKKENPKTKEPTVIVQELEPEEMMDEELVEQDTYENRSSGNRMKSSRNNKRKKEEESSESVSNWFMKQFSNLFSDSDMEIED